MPIIPSKAMISEIDAAPNSPKRLRYEYEDVTEFSLTVVYSENDSGYDATSGDGSGLQPEWNEEANQKGGARGSKW